LGAIVGSGLILAVAIGGAIGWTVWQGTNDPSSMPVATNRLPTPTEIVEQAFLWVLQSIGGVPFRDQPSPAAVFAIAFCLFLVLIALATAKGTARQRAVASALTCIAFAVPIVLTIATFSRLGFSWQGRYTLPLTVGLPLLAGWGLEHHRPLRRLARPWCFMTLTGVVAIQVIAIWHVRGLEGGKWPNGRWTHFESSTSALILLGAAALALATVAVLTTRHSALDTPRNLTLTPPREPART
jgi:hypothetical protein